MKIYNSDFAAGDMQFSSLLCGDNTSEIGG